MIYLDEAQRIGAGSARVCYRHPDDPAKCIKVDKPGKGKQSAEDARYHSILNRRQVKSKHIAAYYGEVSTNLGKGLVFELMTDLDGSLSETLAAHLKRGEHSEEHIEQIVVALCELRDDLIANNIIVRDFHPGNLSLRKLEDGDIRLTMFDGVGNSDFIPLATYNRWWGRKKLLRKWGRMEKFMKAFGTNITPQQIAALQKF